MHDVEEGKGLAHAEDGSGGDAGVNPAGEVGEEAWWGGWVDGWVGGWRRTRRLELGVGRDGVGGWVGKETYRCRPRRWRQPSERPNPSATSREEDPWG